MDVLIKKYKPGSLQQLSHAILIVMIALFIPVGGALAVRNYPLKVPDCLGIIHTFNNVPVRVVSLVPAATEILFEIGAGPYITGVTYHDALLPGAAGKKVVGGFLHPSINAVKSAAPDMIILSPMHHEIADAFRHTDVKLFHYTTQNITDTYNNIALLGSIFEKQKKSEHLVQQIESDILHIRQKLEKADILTPKRVIRLMGRDMVMTPGMDSFQNALIRLAGGTPPDFNKKGAVVPVTKEEWISFNPQVIYGCESDKKIAETILSTAGWNSVDAVKNSQIFYFPCDLTCRASAHTGYLINWLSATVYSDAFGDKSRYVKTAGIREQETIPFDLEYVSNAGINKTTLYDFQNKTFIVRFKSPQAVVSTLEGKKEQVRSIGNHYSPPPVWPLMHKTGWEEYRKNILAANQMDDNAALMVTGVDMDSLSICQRSYKELKVVAVATAGVLGNSMRMSKDSGAFYEPGTINILLMTNSRLSDRAMTRAIITTTEAKTAVLEDLDIRSSYLPLSFCATGTGTDNIIVVQGEGPPVDLTGGHTKMGELIAASVYGAVKESISKQNGIRAGRHVFQRLKERGISIYEVVSEYSCPCINQTDIHLDKFVKQAEHLLLNPYYASFLESAFALSDAHEKGLIKDPDSFKNWSLAIANEIAGSPVMQVENLLAEKEMPVILAHAFNAIFTGISERMRNE